MTYDNLPAFAWVFGAVTAAILLAFGIRALRRALRENNAKWQQLTDPTRCWECGQLYHFPCPDTTWWRNQ